MLTQVVVRVSISANQYYIAVDNESDVSKEGLVATLGAINTTTLMNEELTLDASESHSFSLGPDDEMLKGIQPGGSDFAEFQINNLMKEQMETYKTGLEGFIGSGKLTWEYNVVSYAAVTPGPTTMAIHGTTGGQMEITYYYAAIPEPATLAILAVSGAAFVVRRRRLYLLPV